MKNKDWKERLKVNDGDWFGLSLFIDDEGVFDEYKAGGVLVSSAEEKLKNFIEEVREEAKEEGRREVLNKETFVGDYDILMEGLHIRTIDRENFLAQIYKTVKERYDWAFGTATYKQALKMIENSLTSPLTPYVGTDKMIDEARIEVLSKLNKKK